MNAQDPAKTASNARKRDKYRHNPLENLHLVRNILIIALALFLLLRFVVGFGFVDGFSMYPTFRPGELVLFARMHPALQRGDVVNLDMPEGYAYIKRVVAVAGDEVDLRDGVVYINGQAETGSYVSGVTYPEEGAFSYPLTVGEGDIFVLGDNREGSVDSRFYGVFSLSTVQGVVKLQIGLNPFTFRTY